MICHVSFPTSHLTLAAGLKGACTDITTTGIFVSQLEVEFGVTAACVPTVWRIVEDLWVFVARRVFHVELKGSTWNRSDKSSSTEMKRSSRSSRNTSSRLYSQVEDVEAGSTDDGYSKACTVRRDEPGQITVNTTYAIYSRSMGEDEDAAGAVAHSAMVNGHGWKDSGIRGLS
jgi:hypothetical protein